MKKVIPVITCSHCFYFKEFHIRICIVMLYFSIVTEFLHILYVLFCNLHVYIMTHWHLCYNSVWIKTIFGQNDWPLRCLVCSLAHLSQIWHHNSPFKPSKKCSSMNTAPSGNTHFPPPLQLNNWVLPFPSSASFSLRENGWMKVILNCLTQGEVENLFICPKDGIFLWQHAKLE